jgi:HAD superfamily phosphoserine phosphatase-like hydrolase
MIKIAIFDVCDTLYRVNTTFQFLDEFFKKKKLFRIYKKISNSFFLKSLNYLIYKSSDLDLVRIVGTLFLKGFKVEEIKKFTHNFVYKTLSSQINEIIFEKIRDYKDRGYKIILMSGSYDFIIKEVADYFDISEYYASKLKIIDGFYTGQFERDILMNKKKLLIKKFGKIDYLSVISNNKSDADLMHFADEAFAICNKKRDLKFWSKFPKIKCIEMN